MLDFLGNFSSVLISIVVLGGFFAIAAVFIFELGAMFTFWRKHSWRGPSISPRNREEPTIPKMS